LKALDFQARFRTGRSVVMGTRGMVASSQPLASAEGIKILMQGGSAADAAVTMAATLQVLEPMMTGLGGDMFALYYDEREQTLHGLNASGRSPAAISREYLVGRGMSRVPEEGFCPVMVPAALKGWAILHERFGSMEFDALLQPAIRFAREGFPVAPKTAALWAQYVEKLKRFPAASSTYLIDGRAPLAGELFRQPDLAGTIEKIARKGIDEFYSGETAEKIADYFLKNGGLLAQEDLEECSVQWVKPISTEYMGHTVYELPPNGQGMMVIEALNILKKFDLSKLHHNSSEYIHIMIEATRLAFADAYKFVADPDVVDIPVEELISQEYAAGRANLIDTGRAIAEPEAGIPGIKGDTTYFTVVDRDLNAVSFINSIFHPFGAGVVIDGMGVCLGNRGCLFSMERGHPNVIAPRKRPYNTIIPAMLFRDDKPVLSFGVMGGFMQPQGHLQVISNLLNFGMNIQEAIESPRYRVMEAGTMALEKGFSPDAAEALSAKGHEIQDGGQVFFGGAQGIVINRERGVFEGGSDPRMDGCAIGW